MSGTVTDVNGDLIPGATIALEGATPTDSRTALANDNGVFEFDKLQPGTPFRVVISAKGFDNWQSPTVNLMPGQFFFLPAIKLGLSDAVTSITVSASTEQIAVQQVRLEEQQRVLGFIPNFYVVYDSNAVPLTTKLKFELALRVSADPINFVGAAFLAGINQAGGTPAYLQGAKGYGQRLGSTYLDGFTDIVFGGAILPSLLHQDPRYFYQGTRSNISRTFHALSNPFVCRGDNGRLQPNYSSVGGDLISSALSNAYYPKSDRGAGLVFDGFFISTGVRLASSLVQEFVLRKLTPSARNR